MDQTHQQQKELLAVEMINITKKFGTFTANNNINLDIRKGEVHAILGENGAGKSTLMNILYGLVQQSSGEIKINGKTVEMKNPNVAISNGIGMVHQHFMLIQPFTVAENIILGNEPTSKFGVVDEKKTHQTIKKISDLYGLSIDLDAKVQSITVGMQQRVEIIKTLYRGAEILILDEPTAVLTPQEIKELGTIIRNLTSQGKTIIIITHKLAEIKSMADRCTIIRRGVKTGTVNVKDVSEQDLASMMVGREVIFKIDKKPAEIGEVTLEVSNLCVKNNKNLLCVKGLNLSLHRGEILGIAGIDGNGQSELIEAITGLRKVESGKVTIFGKDITSKTPKQIINNKIAHIPEDRQKRGLVLEYSVEDNSILKTVDKTPFSKNKILQRDPISTYAKKLIEQFDIRTPSEKAFAKGLSGGNQQKVIIAREVSESPDVLIAAQPTRGLDVGAIEYVQRALINERDNGRAVLLVSFELEEIMNIADTIAVIYDGKIVKILDPKQTDENEIGLLMAGGASNAK